MNEYAYWIEKDKEFRLLGMVSIIAESTEKARERLAEILQDDIVSTLCCSKEIR